MRFCLFFVAFVACLPVVCFCLVFVVFAIFYIFSYVSSEWTVSVIDGGGPRHYSPQPSGDDLHPPTTCADLAGGNSQC